MPTNLPPRSAKSTDKPTRSIFTVLLNAFMVSSAVLLGLAVVLQEERYIKGEPSYFAGMFERTADGDAKTMAD